MQTLHVRFAKQTDSFRCGPIALLNLMKLKGYKVSIAKDLPRLSKMLKCNEEIGTDRGHFKKCLKRLKNKIGTHKHIIHPTYTDIVAALRQDKPIIASVAYRHDYPVAGAWNNRDEDYALQVGGHYALIFRDAEGWDIGINLFRGETIFYLNENIIRAHILTRYNEAKSKKWAYPQIWIFNHE